MEASPSTVGVSPEGASAHGAGVTLTDGVITLRPWRSDDAAAVFDACQDPLVARFTRVPHPYAVADAEAFVQDRRHDWLSGEQRSFAVVDAVSGALLGAMTRFAPNGHRVEFGYWVAPEARGRKVATRALRTIVEWTLETTDLVRLEVQTLVANLASARVAEGAGFERESIRRAWVLDADGRPLDMVFYVLIRPPDR